MGNLAIKEPPEFQEKIHQVEEEEYLTAELENGIKGALLNNDVYLKKKLEETKKETEKVKGLSNLNILINPNFKINQRAMTEYTVRAGNPQIYTFDRWKTFQGAKNNVTVRRITDEGSGVYIEVMGEGWALGQYVENFEDYAGKTVTISAKIKDMAGSWRIFVSETDTSYHLLDFDNIINEIVKATFTLSATATRLLACFHFIEGFNDDIGWIDVEWVKLELGDIATSYMPPAPAIELAKCQRYYFYESSEWSTIMEIGNDYDVGKRINFPTTMRTLPTITLNGEGEEHVLTDDNLNYYSENGFDCCGKGLIPSGWLIGDIYVDAEIY